jgi:hypothetical protein
VAVAVADAVEIVVAVATAATAETAGNRRFNRNSSPSITLSIGATLFSGGR